MLTEGRPQLLATKILRPRTAPGLIERQRLNELAAQVPEKQLAIIKAGAGFGKTSLALSWAQSLEENGHRVAWFSVDAEDNEPTHFLFYFAHALRHACAELVAGNLAHHSLHQVQLYGRPKRIYLRAFGVGAPDKLILTRNAGWPSG